VSWRAAVTRYPVGEGVTVDKLPVDELGFGCLRHYAPAHGIPAVEHFLDVGEIARERPGFVDVMLVAMREDPTAIGAAFEGREEEVNIWACGNVSE
jgi:hypothetical protein